ncbi:MAG TPA: hypothetical protein VJ848_03595 [Candidatus Angelobacter sp.]|jgi:hypothetical protein|nr:hypothetical protein [Candidatus Angelobacter sp.]
MALTFNLLPAPTDHQHFARDAERPFTNANYSNTFVLVEEEGEKYQ